MKNKILATHEIICPICKNKHMAMRWCLNIEPGIIFYCTVKNEYKWYSDYKNKLETVCIADQSDYLNLSEYDILLEIIDLHKKFDKIDKKLDGLLKGK